MVIWRKWEEKMSMTRDCGASTMALETGAIPDVAESQGVTWQLCADVKHWRKT
jgi:hypothetical protein